MYRPYNQCLPFGPHPHCGFGTVTFILWDGVLHKDSSGYESVVAAGVVQWVTTGVGLIHAEVPSDEFKEAVGGLEIL